MAPLIIRNVGFSKSCCTFNLLKGLSGSFGKLGECAEGRGKVLSALTDNALMDQHCNFHSNKCISKWSWVWLLCCKHIHAMGGATALHTSLPAKCTWVQHAPRTWQMLEESMLSNGRHACAFCPKSEARLRAAVGNWIMDTRTDLTKD
jgi:hypothetical protein